MGQENSNENTSESREHVTRHRKRHRKVFSHENWKLTVLCVSTWSHMKIGHCGIEFECCGIALKQSGILLRCCGIDYKIEFYLWDWQQDWIFLVGLNIRLIDLCGIALRHRGIECKIDFSKWKEELIGCCESIRLKGKWEWKICGNSERIRLVQKVS